MPDGTSTAITLCFNDLRALAISRQCPLERTEGAVAIPDLEIESLGPQPLGRGLRSQASGGSPSMRSFSSSTDTRPSSSLHEKLTRRSRSNRPEA